MCTKAAIAQNLLKCRRLLGFTCGCDNLLTYCMVVVLLWSRWGGSDGIEA